MPLHSRPQAQMPAQAPQMQDPRAALLAQMEDVITPEGIDSWPPAPGWWLLVILVIASLLAAVRFARNKVRAQRYRKVVLAALDTIIAERDTDETSGSEKIMQVLKRTFFTAYPKSREHVAGIYGQQWLALLQKTSKKPVQLQNINAIVEEALYGKSGSDNRVFNDLMLLAKNWVKDHKPMSDQVWQDIVAVSNAGGPKHV